MRTSIILGTDEHLTRDGFRPLIEIARIADEIGIEVVTLPEHLAMSSNNAEFIARYGENPPVDTETRFPEPMVFMGALAYATKRIRLGTSIILTPLRPALVMAKQMATLDYMAGGRTIFGLGAGWQKEEFDATNMPWEGRHSHLVEQIEAFRALWSQAPASYHGKFINFDGLNSKPFPVQGKDVPLVLGLQASERNIQRMADLGVGWMPMPSPAAPLAEPIGKIRKAWAAAGRKAADLEIMAFSDTVIDGAAPSLEKTLALVPQYAEVGVTTLQLAPSAFTQEVSGYGKVLEAIQRAVKG